MGKRHDITNLKGFQIFFLPFSVPLHSYLLSKLYSFNIYYIRKFFALQVFMDKSSRITKTKSRWSELLRSEPNLEISCLKEKIGSREYQVQVLTHPRLVNANEITILQPTVLEHAQPVLTPSERLKRNDELILKAILDKQTILAQYLPGDNVRLARKWSD